MYIHTSIRICTYTYNMQSMYVYYIYVSYVDGLMNTACIQNILTDNTNNSIYSVCYKPIHRILYKYIHKHSPDMFESPDIH